MHIRQYLYSMFLLIGIVVISCTASKRKTIKPTLQHFPPGTCKIIGTIIAIDNTRLSKEQNTPCSKQPCWATVKIDSVIGCGAGAPTIGKKDILTVKFAFTLGKTIKKLFPNLDKRLPGLKIGSKFEASLTKLNVFNLKNSKNKKLYQVYTYKVFPTIK